MFTTMKNIGYAETPIGLLSIVIEEEKVTSITITEDAMKAEKPCCELLRIVTSEIESYFAGTQKEFSFPVTMNGTAFQKEVWEELCRIPYGATATYGEIARRINRPTAVRAVGMACNKNPLLIAVPCHRVVGRNGSLTGFAVGIERKRFLLNLEKGTYNK